VWQIYVGKVDQNEFGIAPFRRDLVNPRANNLADPIRPGATNDNAYPQDNTLRSMNRFQATTASSDFSQFRGVHGHAG
jgi:hypothetical protein